MDSFKKSLKIDFEKLYFQRNSKWLVPGVVISLLTLVCMVLSAPEVAGAVFYAGLAVHLDGGLFGTGLVHGQCMENCLFQ